MAFIELSGVSKGYGSAEKRTHVLEDVNLSIERGELVSIVGYSGAGKTTLVSLLAGLIKPDQGTVKVDGKIVTGPGPERGVVFQNYSLLPWLSVLENVQLAVDQVFPKMSAAERRDRAMKFVEMVNLGPAAGKRPRELSGGMRQRVSVARALAIEPEVLLLDEPFGALDALTRGVLQGELQRISQESGKTMLLITNDVDEGILLSDRIIPLGAGPRASLGPATTVEIERPRDRKELNHDPRFRAIRLSVLEYLLESGKAKRAERAARDQHDAEHALDAKEAPKLEPKSHAATSEPVQIAEVSP
ncbi:MAG TPA: ABC transporter ATP-binding protein [Polyangiaceae bacterium]|nr:ABC transporter ATP-binding protein [Polyangiaceae bacterium]